MSARKCIVRPILLLALAAAVPRARGEVTRIIPPVPVVLGDLIRFTAPDDGKPTRVIGWYWTVWAEGPSGARWQITQVGGQGTSALTFTTFSPATYTVRCRVTYAGPNPPPSRDLAPVQVASPPPTTVTVASGDGDTVYYRDDHTMVFAAWTGSLALGPQSGGQAQEQLVDRVYFGGLRPKDSDWVPEIPADTFRLTHGMIYDTQHPDAGDFLGAPIGRSLTFRQHLRVRFGYADNTFAPYPIGTIRVAWTKVDATHYTVSATVE